MAATKLPITIEQGSDFDLVVTVVGGPPSLSGYTGAMQIRQIKSSDTPLFSVPSGMITVDAQNRQVAVDLPASVTGGFDWDNGLYDLVISSTNGTDAYRILEGKVSIDHSVTRED